MGMLSNGPTSESETSNYFATAVTYPEYALFQSAEACTLSKHFVITIAFTLLFIGIAQISEAAQQEVITLSTLEQIQDEFGRVPCDNGKRLDAVKTLFE